MMYTGKWREKAGSCQFFSIPKRRMMALLILGRQRVIRCVTLIIPWGVPWSLSPTPECGRHAEGSKICTNTDSEMFSAPCPEMDPARHISVFYCMATPMAAPVIYTCCWKRILGCQTCVDCWYAGEGRVAQSAGVIAHIQRQQFWRDWRITSSDHPNSEWK